MRKCVFCPSTKLSREHVWSDWINEVLPDMTFNFQRRNRDGSYTRWQLPGLHHKARVACKKCNSEWMSDLETKEAKPSLTDMIRYGGSISILPRGIASIAAFAFKQSVISNASGFYSHQPFFSMRQRNAFRRTLEVPSGVNVWMFAVSTPGFVSGKLHSYFGNIELDVKYRFKIYSCTFAIGFVGLQLLAGKWSNPRLRNTVAFPPIRQEDRFDDIAVPLFPSDGTPVLWPPRKHLSYDGINAFSNRWKDFDFSRLPI